MALIFKEQPLYIVSINVLIAARVIEFVGNDLSFSLALYFIFQFFFFISHIFLSFFICCSEEDYLRSYGAFCAESSQHDSESQCRFGTTLMTFQDTAAVFWLTQLQLAMLT